ncbi:MAG: FtsW/RodA/SpoVE family cell cycle protein, partial [Oscillospiraceae bacterium]
LLLVLCLIASLFGLILIYSATRYDPALHSAPIKQAMFLCLGVVAYLICSFIDIELVIERSWKILLVLSFLLLLMLIPFGVEGDTGNRSWVYLPGIPVGFQPSELVKVAFVLLLARQLDRQREWGISRPSSVFRVAGLTLIFCAVIAALSKDFGMVLVYLLIFVIMAFSAGVKLRWFALGGVLILAGITALIVLSVKSEAFMVKFGYIIRRFTEVFTRDDPQGIGWQQNRSLLAIGSGKLTGQGYLHGVQTQSVSESSLPARHTDEIFAVCGEEFGLIGCVLVLLLLGAVIIRCFWVGRTARSHLSAYIAIGYGAMLLIQTAINVAFCLYVFPVVGLTLPFFSYGGSSILTLFAAMGIVSGIKMRSLPSWLQDRSRL